MKKAAKMAMVFACGLMAASGLMAGSKGTSGAQFLRIGAGARGPAMAAFSPVADDVTAIYWNPAGLASLEKKELSLSYNAYFKDTAAQFAGFGLPTEKGVFGLGVTMFGVKDIEQRSLAGDTDAPDMGTFNTRDMAVSLGWGDKCGPLKYGAALKYISSDLHTESAKTAAVDMGAMVDIERIKGLSASLAVLNLGGKLKFQDEGDPLPLDVKPGVAYRMDLNRLGRLTLAMDADLLVHDGEAFVQPGLEWQVHKMFALRGGYQFGRDTGAGQGFGVGAGFSFMNFALDYAFVPYGDLGDTHRMSLGVKF